MNELYKHVCTYTFHVICLDCGLYAEKRLLDPETSPVKRVQCLFWEL